MPRFRLIVRLDAETSQAAIEALRRHVTIPFEDMEVQQEYLHPDGRIRTCDVPPPGHNLKSILVRRICGQSQTPSEVIEVFVSVPSEKVLPSELGVIDAISDTRVLPLQKIWAVARGCQSRLEGVLVWAADEWKPLVPLLKTFYG